MKVKIGSFVNTIQIPIEWYRTYRVRLLPLEEYYTCEVYFQFVGPQNFGVIHEVVPLPGHSTANQIYSVIAYGFGSTEDGYKYFSGIKVEVMQNAEEFEKRRKD